MSDDESGLTAKQKGRLAALRSAKEVLGEDASSKDVRDLADYILGESDESVPALVDTEEPDEEDEDVEETEEDDSADDDGEDDDDAEEPAKKAAPKRTARKAPAKRVTRRS